MTGFFDFTSDVPDVNQTLTQSTESFAGSKVTSAKLSGREEYIRQRTMISFIRRVDGVYQLAVDPSLMFARSYGASRELTTFFNVGIPNNATIEMSIPQDNAYDLGRNESQSTVFAIQISYIGMLQRLSQRANLIGMIDCQYSASPAYFMLACTRLMVSQWGEIMISRPSNWGSTNYNKAAEPFFKQSLLKTAINKGFLTEGEAQSIIDGKSVVIRYKDFESRQGANVVLI